MSLQSRINSEGPSRWVHASHVLNVMDVFQNQFMAVVPMAIIQVLSARKKWKMQTFTFVIQHVLFS